MSLSDLKDLFQLDKHFGFDMYYKLRQTKCFSYKFSNEFDLGGVNIAHLVSGTELSFTENTETNISLFPKKSCRRTLCLLSEESFRQ